MSDFKLILITVIITIFLIILLQFILKKLLVKLFKPKLTATSFDKNSTSANDEITVARMEKVTNYTQIIELIDEYEKHQETDDQKHLIAELKKQMKEMISNAEEYEEKMLIATYFIENIFNILNNKKAISFKEFCSILSSQIVKSKSFDPAFKSYVQGRNSGRGI
jgi:hypothetical protein